MLGDQTPSTFLRLRSNASANGDGQSVERSLSAQELAIHKRRLRFNRLRQSSVHNVWKMTDGVHGCGKGKSSASSSISLALLPNPCMTFPCFACLSCWDAQSASRDSLLRVAAAKESTVLSYGSAPACFEFPSPFQGSLATRLSSRNTKSGERNISLSVWSRKRVSSSRTA